MERLIRTSPAYDRRDEPPNYGQHPLEIHFIVKGEKGALVFTVDTGWYIEALNKARLDETFYDLSTSVVTMCSFHAPATIANSVDKDPHEYCEWLNEPCQAHTPFGYTGKALGDLFMTLVSEGLDALWLALEKHYEEI